MKQFFNLAILVVLLFAFISSSLCQRAPPVPECPTDTTETVYKENLLSCTSYYECVNGEPVSRQCEDGLRWNQKQKVR